MYRMIRIHCGAVTVSIILYFFYECDKNIFVGECIGNLAAKLSYKKIEEYGIVMPLRKQLKHPSSYERLTLKQILDNKDNIEVEGINKFAYDKICDYVDISLHSEKPSTSL